MVITRQQAVTGASSTFQLFNQNYTVQAAVVGTGAVTATVLLEVSNDPSLGWLTLATLNLSGTGSATDGIAFDAKWTFIRSNVTAITGTGAQVTVDAGGF